eukprot:COSAG06_NODE_6351_length_2973_cov_2.581072_2_plen_130_part_00
MSIFIYKWLKKAVFLPVTRRLNSRPTAAGATAAAAIQMRCAAFATTAAATSCAKTRGRRHCALPLHLQRRRGGAVLVAGGDHPRVHETVVQLLEAMGNAIFFELFLCLSRACLGKMIVFVYKWWPKWRF